MIKTGAISTSKSSHRNKSVVIKTKIEAKVMKTLLWLSRSATINWVRARTFTSIVWRQIRTRNRIKASSSASRSLMLTLRKILRTTCASWSTARAVGKILLRHSTTRQVVVSKIGTTLKHLRREGRRNRASPKRNWSKTLHARRTRLQKGLPYSVNPEPFSKKSLKSWTILPATRKRTCTLKARTASSRTLFKTSKLAKTYQSTRCLTTQTKVSLNSAWASSIQLQEPMNLTTQQRSYKIL